MKIAINTDPLKTGYRIQGTGVYISQLLKHLKLYFPKHQYISFSRDDNVPNADIVHYPYFNPFFLTLPLRKDYPTVVTVHDLAPLVFPKYFPAGLKGVIKWQIQKLSLKSTVAIITDSKSSKKDIAKFAGIEEEKIHVVYLAPLSNFKKIKISKIRIEELKKKYNLPEKFVLYVGDVIWSKNVPNLIRAIKKSDVILVMVGKQTTDQNFDKNHPWNRDLVFLNKETRDDKKILRLGFVPIEDLVMLYNLATLFIMPSIYEGFGLPILDAMSCGCPVITTRGGSLPEVAGDAAFYIDPYDVNNISAGIEKVFFDERLRKKLSLNGLAQAKKFSWKQTVEQTIIIYEKII